MRNLTAVLNSKSALAISTLSILALAAQAAQVQINTNSDWQSAFPSGSTSADQLWVNGGATLDFDIDSTHQIGAVELGYPYGDDASSIAGILNIKSGTLEVGDLVIGNTLGASEEALSPKSTLNIYGGATLLWTGVNDYNSNRRLESSRQSYSTSELNIDGGAFIVESNMSFNVAGGFASVSSFNISGGGTYKTADGVSSSINLANGQNSRAQALISGSDTSGKSSTLEVSGTVNVGGNATGVQATMTIEDGGKLVSVENSQALNIGNYSDNVATVYLNEGGVIESAGSRGLNITIGAGVNSTASLIVDGGEITKTSAGNNYITVGNNTEGNSNSVLQMKNGAKISQTENNWQIGVQNATMEVLSGSDIYINGNFTVGNSTSKASKLVIDGSGTEIRGSGGETSYAGSLYLANTANYRAEVVVSNGATAVFRNIVASDKTNSQGSLIVKGLGSSVSIGNLDYDTHFGVNQGDAANYAGNSAKLEIWTGAKFSSASGSGNSLKIYDSAQVNFVMDSTTILDASTSGDSMLSYFRVDAYKSDGASKPFVIDASQLKPVEYEGFYEIVLTEIPEGLYLNDELVDFDSMSGEEIFSFVQDNFDFKNCTNIYGWEDIGAEDVYYDVNRLVLQLTSYAVPEPSTCALIFGALAIALAAYRRRHL